MPETLAHKICAKNDQNHAKISKNAAIAQNRQNRIENRVTKKISTAVKN